MVTSFAVGSESSLTAGDSGGGGSAAKAGGGKVNPHSIEPESNTRHAVMALNPRMAAGAEMRPGLNEKLCMMAECYTVPFCE
jgi:hypothetical protein